MLITIRLPELKSSLMTFILPTPRLALLLFPDPPPELGELHAPGSSSDLTTYNSENGAQNLRLIRPPVTRKYSLTTRRGAGNVSESHRGGSGGALTAVNQCAQSPGNPALFCLGSGLETAQKADGRGCTACCDPRGQAKSARYPRLADCSDRSPGRAKAASLRGFGRGSIAMADAEISRQWDFRSGLPGPHCTSISFQGVCHCFD